MVTEKLNPKIVRARAREKNIESITALAVRIGKTRQAIYFALENPRRFPVTYRRICNAIK
jgi:hypothetical protein